MPSRMGFKEQIQRMKKHVACLRSRANHLQREQDGLQSELMVLQDMVLIRDLWLGVDNPANPCTDAAPAAEDEDEASSADAELLRLLGHTRPHDFQEHLPLAACLSQIDSSMCAQVAALTPQVAARTWMQYVQDAGQLLVLHRHDPGLAEPLLLAHMSRCIGWVLAVWALNARVGVDLHDVNLATGVKAPPPPGHWRGVFVAAGYSSEQCARMRTALLLTKPRLEQLQEQQQALMRQLAELQRESRGPPLAQQGAASATAAPPPAAHGGCPLAAGWYAAAAAAGVDVSGMLSGHSPPGEQADAADTAQPGAPSSSGSSGGSASSGPVAAAASAGASASSNRARQRQMARVQELMQQLSGNFEAWKMVVNTRAQYSAYVTTPLQAARLVVAAAPYFIIGAPIFDEVMAASNS